ncbi:hypothetical protein AB4250_12860 [Vibrio cyclitrophicus]
MITNLPEPSEFKSLSVQYLVQAIDHILKTELAIAPLSLLDDSFELEEEWENRQGILGNSLIMLFLSIENYFKYKVCLKCPTELLTEESSSHLSTPDSIDFEKLYIVGLEELTSKYQKIEGNVLSGSALDTLEQLRIRRNKFTHGLHRELIEPKDIVHAISVFLTEIWGNKWVSDLKEVMLTEPLYGMLRDEEEDMQLLQYYKFFEKYLSNRKFRKLIGMPERGRRYLCPHCQDSSIESGSLLNADYACLEPNTPESTEVHCWLCQEYAEVERISCNDEKCPANVIYPTDSFKLHINNCCLTCCGEQGN